jgi:hypothetical protein
MKGDSGKETERCYVVVHTSDLERQNRKEDSKHEIVKNGHRCNPVILASQETDIWRLEV